MKRYSHILCFVILYYFSLLQGEWGDPLYIKETRKEGKRKKREGERREREGGKMSFNTLCCQYRVKLMA